MVELAEFLLRAQRFEHSEISPELKALLLKYDWPGNVGELKNVLERAVILSGGEPLTVDEFSLEVDSEPLAPESGRSSAPGGLESAEREMILAALEKAGGNKTEAARLLKITRRRLYSRMKVHGLKP